jgi:signal transduction histidine kinase
MASAMQLVQKKEKAIEELIHLAAHQLRNPLTVAMGSVSLLEDDLPKEMQREILQDIKKSIDRLNRIVGSFLTAAKIESGQIELELVETDLSCLVEEAVDRYLSAAKHKDIQLDLSVHQTVAPILACDREKILQAVENLIDNAIKYSPEGSRVTVRLFSGKEGVHIQVTDSGIGFSPDEQKSLFAKHFRTDAAKSYDRRGLGFGLYFVKKVIEAHGGSVEANSDGSLRGSSFMIEFSTPKLSKIS